MHDTSELYKEFTFIDGGKTRVSRCVGIDSKPTYKHTPGRYLILSDGDRVDILPRDQCAEVRAKMSVLTT